jgi:hypothetical protein
MNLQQLFDKTQATLDPSVRCAHANLEALPGCGRPFPSVRRLYSSRRHRHITRPALIAITQRDDTVVLRASEARRLAHALMRAAGRR